MKLKKLINKMNLEIVNMPNEIDADTFEFDAQGTTTGYYESNGFNVEKRILILGNADEKILTKKTDEEVMDFLDAMSNVEVIVASIGFNIEIIESKIKKQNKILLKSSNDATYLISLINYYISYWNANLQRVHASLVKINGEGVLIIGKSGIGKSELAIDLIKKDHQFVGDDAIDIFKVGDKFIGKSAPITRNFIEVRGLGVVNVQKTFGIQSLLSKSEIDLVIELVDLKDVKSTVERLGNNYSEYVLDEGTITKIQIPVSSGKNLTSIVESAVNVFKLKKYDNYVAIDEMTKE